MNLHVRFVAVAALSALTWAAAPAGAQSASPVDARAVGLVPPSIVDSVTAAAGAAPSESTAAVMTRGPSRASARVASHAVSTPRGAPPVIQNRKSNKNALALMIVGGAALVIGAVIGDDAGTIVMLGGAGVGLYGLYLFLT
jgi:hypothetical protein